MYWPMYTVLDTGPVSVRSPFVQVLTVPIGTVATRTIPEEEMPLQEETKNDDALVEYAMMLKRSPEETFALNDQTEIVPSTFPVQFLLKMVPIF